MIFGARPAHLGLGYMFEAWLEDVLPPRAVELAQAPDADDASIVALSEWLRDGMAHAGLDGADVTAVMFGAYLVGVAAMTDQSLALDYARAVTAVADAVGAFLLVQRVVGAVGAVPEALP